MNSIMGAAKDLSDPRLILLIVYGVFVFGLAICAFVRVICGEGCCRRAQAVANEEEIQIEVEGFRTGYTIYEFLSVERKNEIDSLRHKFFSWSLRKFSLTLQEEHALQRRKSNSLVNGQSSDEVEQDIELGFESKEAGQVDQSTDSKEVITKTYTHISIPRPGVDVNGKESMDVGEGATKREVPIFCAICLSEYEMDDEVCWSSNSNCTHVFHKACIIQWLVALGRRKSSMRRFPPTPSMKRLLNYQMGCPCCRQEFIQSKSDKQKV
mmetsp:Transcript_26155/g.55176  ORF Transcript_26155/g.55176 Transcript_26155/m.55176 type:complete len:267 (-) Transcript_26155:198-998(-)